MTLFLHFLIKLVLLIQGTEYYDGKAKRYVDFPITDILQMMGRAGRPQYDQHGKAVILVHEPKKSFYKKVKIEMSNFVLLYLRSVLVRKYGIIFFIYLFQFLYEPFPVESNLREQLHNHINAEIVSGTICHKEDAVHYLTWTYLFRRLVWFCDLEIGFIFYLLWDDSGVLGQNYARNFLFFGITTMLRTE